MRPVELLEQRAAGDPESADRPLLVELSQQLADRGVEFGQAVEPAMAQRPSSQRSMISTAASTLALSRGRRGRAGRIAVS